jgi:AcrR family transcriptional regulator
MEDEVTDSARRAEVVSLARTAFFTRGYAATSTRDLARQLGILGGSIYHHIDTKEQLLFEIVRGSFASGAALAEDLRSGPGTVEERLRRWVRGHVRAMASHTVTIGLMFHEADALTPEHAAEVTQLNRAYATAVVETLGELGPDLDAKLAAQHLLGAMNSMYRWYRPDGRLAPDALGERLSTLLLDGLAPGAAGAGGALAEAVIAGSAAPRRSPELEQILAVAADLFASGGVVGTSMQDIATGVSVRKASLYRHVASKELLLYALVERVMARTAAGVEQVRGADADPLTRLCALLEFQASIIGDHRAETRLILHERRALRPEHQRELLDGEQAFRRLLAELVVEGQGQGLIPADRDAGLAALSGLGSLNWMYRWYRPGGPASARELGRGLTAMLIAGLTALSSE